MPRTRRVILTTQQFQELQQERDHSLLPYVRVRAAAILKVAEGFSVREVALHRLLKPVKPDLVHAWITRYEVEGLQGLYIREGRGRKKERMKSADPSPLSLKK